MRFASSDLIFERSFKSATYNLEPTVITLCELLSKYSSFIMSSDTLARDSISRL